MNRHLGKDQCVECGQPANHRMVCPAHEADYANDNRTPVSFTDDVQPDQRGPKEEA
jgi:hypothetical protein